MLPNECPKGISFALQSVNLVTRLNVQSESTQINWVALGSQVGSTIAFIGMATFFIRWNNQWFQKHADEEFNLKRLDLDIDRANWLVELSMEWKNITKSEIPSDLIDTLSRNLFALGESKEVDIHPAETLLSALFGKAGSLSMELPGKLTVQRSDLSSDNKNGAKKKSRKLKRKLTRYSFASCTNF